MYQALLDRDRGFDGVFFVGVKTTRIFCRPTCPARKPKVSNVEFFGDSRSALLAGYRACKRCTPLQVNSAPPASLLELIEAIEGHPEQRLRERDLRARGLDPSTIRRQFQKYFGMTFHAYQRARRMGLAFQEIRYGSSVVPTQQSSGYQSASGFWKSFRRVFGQPPSRSAEVQILSAKWIDTPLGAMLAIANDEGLQLLEFVDRPALETEIRTLQNQLGGVVVPGAHDNLVQIEQDVASYFSGESFEWQTNVALRGTEFERAVWRELLEIPPGQTRSYQQIADSVGRATAVRAVGRANGKNCLAVIVPCHRVIGADGKLTGYGGGLWRKQWLLDHEQANAQA